MSLADDKAIRGETFVDFQDIKQSLHALLEQRNQIGIQLERLGKQLQSEDEIPATDLQNCELFLGRDVRDRIIKTETGIKEAKTELARLGKRLEGFGYGDVVNSVKPS